MMIWSYFFIYTIMLRWVFLAKLKFSACILVIVVNKGKNGNSI